MYVFCQHEKFISEVFATAVVISDPTYIRRFLNGGDTFFEAHLHTFYAHNINNNKNVTAPYLTLSPSLSHLFDYHSLSLSLSSPQIHPSHPLSLSHRRPLCVVFLKQTVFSRVLPITSALLMAVKVSATFTRTLEAIFAPSEAEEERKGFSENIRIRGKKVSRMKAPP
jgi:hypothetical protein